MSGSVSSTSNATAGTPASGAAANATGLGIGASFNTFLTLLTTQLKNQDPTNAMDTNAMTQQLVSFASVEQQINMNSSLQTLIGLQQTNSLTAAAPLMGKTVEVASTQLPLQNGRAMLRLPAAGAATTADITIVDSTGRVVRTATARLGSGATDWSWDGKNGISATLPDGAYKFSVAGRDPAGGPQTITANVVATATSTSIQTGSTGTGNTLLLNLGGSNGIAVPFTAVRSIDGS